MVRPNTQHITTDNARLYLAQRHTHSEQARLYLANDTHIYSEHAGYPPQSLQLKTTIQVQSGGIMVYNTGLYGNYYNDYFYNQYLQQQNGATTTPQVIGLAPQQQAQPQQAAPAEKVEADDGKISLGKKIGNFFKGVGKFFTGLFTDENGKFSLGKTLKTALTAVGIGAICVLTAGTAVPAIIAAGAVVGSGVGVAKGAIRAANATTDAEAEAAWQSIGSSTTGLALSVVGARAVAKGSGATIDKGIKGYAQGVKHVFKVSKDAAVNSFKGVSGAWKGAAGTGVTGRLSAVKDNVVAQGKEFGSTVKTNYNNAVTGIKDKINNESTRLEEKQTKWQERADKATGKRKEFYQSKADKLQRQIDARNEINNTTNYKQADRIISNKQTELNAKTEQLKTATGDDAKVLRQEIRQLKDELSVQREILSRRCYETNIYEAQIAAKQKQLDALDLTKPENATKATELRTQISELETKANQFETRTTIERNSGSGVKTAQENFNEAKAALEEAKAKGVGVARAEAKYQRALRDLNSTKGNQYTHAAREIYLDAKHNPAANWLTIETAGRKEHYPTLTPEQMMLLQQYGYVA